MQGVFNKRPVEALHFLVWYLYTPEAIANKRVRSSVQLWFLGLAGSHEAANDPILQEQIIDTLKDMVLNWKGQYYYVIPRCCKLLAATGRQEVLPVVATGIQLSDAEYTQTLRMNARDDRAYYTNDQNDELQEWEKFKQHIAEAIGS